MEIISSEKIIGVLGIMLNFAAKNCEIERMNHECY